MKTTFALVLVAAALAGCAGQSRHRETTYSQAFEQGRYAQAYEQSSRIAGSLSGGDKEQAALIAGLSAHAMDRNDDAERWLRPLVDSRDSAIAGRAGVTLGLVEQERGSHARAAALLADAGAKLEGPEAARAHMYAGDSLSRLGRRTDAREAYMRASSLAAGDTGLASMIGERLGAPGSGGAGRFTVQVGAFTRKTSAETEAARHAARGSRVVSIVDAQGRTLWAVRIGLFATRQEADATRRQMGASARVVAAE